MSEGEQFQVKKYDALPELFFENSYIKPLLVAQDTKNLACYHIRILPNASVVEAYHKKAEEMIWIMRGDGVAVLADKEILLEKGTILHIRPFTTHGFRAGSEGLEMLSVTTPRVDNRTDFFWKENQHQDPELKVISGDWH